MSGILDQIDMCMSQDYGKLTLESLTSFMADLSLQYKPERPMVVYTGYIGMVIFDLTMQGLTELDWIKYNVSYVLHSKYTKDVIIIVNLGVKHGMHKLIVRRGKEFQAYTIEVRYGTEVIDHCSSFKEAFEKYSYPAKLKCND